jgi:hypothetical protein
MATMYLPSEGDVVLSTAGAPSMVKDAAFVT